MGVRTRSATTSPVKPTSAAPPASKTPAVKRFDSFKQFILPQNTSSRARFLLLRHPRDNVKRRFYFCPEKGLYEFTKITPPSIDPKSILFTQATSAQRCKGYVNKTAEYFVATPYDIAFLLLPILSPAKAKSAKSLFQPLDDLLEEHFAENQHLRYVFDHGRGWIESGMERVCDSVEAGDQKMYRLNDSRTLASIIARAERAIEAGLPKSMEEKFVTQALEAPVLSVKREPDLSAVNGQPWNGDVNLAATESFDSQSSTGTIESSANSVFSEAATVTSDRTGVEDKSNDTIHHLQRLRTAFRFILLSYLPPHLTRRLEDLIASRESSIDFTPLDEQLKLLTSLRAEAMSSRSMSDYSRKRGIDDDDEAAESRAEKKRKQEEEDKKRTAGESKGVRDLKKVNVSGMKKMSDFFSKKPATATAKT